MNRHVAPQATPPVIWRQRPRPAATLSERIGAATRRFVHLTVCGLVMGGIVHIAVVLMVPWLARNDAASRFGDLGADGRAERILPQAGEQAVADLDPATAVAACGYDLSEGPIKVAARTGASPLAISIHPRGGGVAYAITDRAAIRGTLEFVMLTPTQLADRIGRDDDGSSARELRVTLTRQQGVVIARALVRRPSDRAEAESLVTAMSCLAAD